MSIEQAQNIAREIAEEAEQRGYTYWSTRRLPVAYELNRGGLDFFVEILLLEETDEYLQLGVDVDYYTQPNCNAMYTAVVRKKTV